MCIDCRAFKKITIGYKFSIPLLYDLFDQLHGSVVFSKIDLRSSYHHIKIRLGNEWRIEFKTKEGVYE